MVRQSARLRAPDLHAPELHAPELPAAEPEAAAESDASGRQKLLSFFQSGRNGSNQELALRFGVSPASISVYRSQFKKLGVTPGDASASAKAATRVRPVPAK